MNQLLKPLALLLFTTALLGCASSATLKVTEGAALSQSKTTILGVDRIGIVVRDLESMLAFYTKATDFTVSERATIKNNTAADILHAQTGVEYEIAVLEAPNMRLELVQYNHNSNATRPISNMPPQGPGMTHTCYQSPSTDPGYDKFVSAGLDLLTRGDAPVDIGGYGVTYAYGYDPEGNMIELEQLDQTFLSAKDYDDAWAVQDFPLWMSQVALVTPDLPALASYYSGVLGFDPYRTGDYANNAKLDAVTDIDNLALSAAWFKMDGPAKVLELWQYKSPATGHTTGGRNPDSLGYTFSLVVGDIDQEYQRLTKLGVKFFSQPQRLGEYRLVFAKDIDGNIYSLRQSVSSDSNDD